MEILWNTPNFSQKLVVLTESATVKVQKSKLLTWVYTLQKLFVCRQLSSEYRGYSHSLKYSQNVM